MSKVVRKAKLTDFPLTLPILKQILNKVDMDIIKALPKSQFYDLVEHGSYSPHYWYSHNRMWVEADEMDHPVGIMVMYGYDDRGPIDISSKGSYPEVRLPFDAIIFSDREALPHEWYLDTVAASPKRWGEGIGQQLIKFVPKVTKQKGHKKISLNIDWNNPRVARLCDHMGFETTSTMTVEDRMYNHIVKKVN